MPPCMQTSVAPSSQASCGAVGDLVEGERVGVGVGAPLGERAEPAADVADVGEVDVAVDDVGHLVADRLAAQVVGQPDRPARAAAPRRSSGSARARRRGCPGPARRRPGPPRTPSARESSVRSVAADRRPPRPRDRVPVAVDVGEVGAAVVGAALGVDRGEQVGPARRRRTRRRAPATAARSGVRRACARPSSRGEGGDVGGDPRVEPRLAGPDVLRVHGQPRPAARSRTRR